MPIDTSIDFVAINIAVITISDSRTLENDTSGDTLEKRINEAGHNMMKRTIIPDDVSKIKENRNRLSVTLNYKKRLQEKKNNDLKNTSLDTSIKITEIFPIENILLVSPW